MSTEDWLHIPCKAHSREATFIIIRPYDNLVHKIDFLANFYCNQCLVETSLKDRKQLSCIPVKEFKDFFEVVININQYLSPTSSHMAMPPVTSLQSQNKDSIPSLVNFIKSQFVGQEWMFGLQEDFILSEITSMVRSVPQKIMFSETKCFDLGESDFSGECMAYASDRSLLFAGNRMGKLYVIQEAREHIIKTLECPNRIGAVKYLPEKGVVVVVGLTKFIVKIDVNTLEITHLVKDSQASVDACASVVEYIPKLDALLMGGFDIGCSFELYDYKTLTVRKRVAFNSLNIYGPENLWVASKVESHNLLFLGYTSGRLQVWDSNSLTLKYSKKTHEHICSIEYQKSNRYVYTAHMTGIIRLWKCTDSYLVCLKKIDTQGSIVNKMRFLNGPYEKYFIMSNFSRKLSLWTDMGERVDELTVFQEPSRGLLVLDDNTIISAGGTVGKLYFINIQSLKG